MSSWQRSSSSELRASDAERERVVDFLRENSLVGRLTHDELDERIGLAYAAVTRGDLERLLVDLPRGDARHPAPRPRRVSTPAAKKREPSGVMVLVGLAALAIPMAIMAGVIVAIAAVFALSVVVGPFVVVALILIAALRRRRPPGPGWQRPHYG
jgi:Domain of unknown function (DUF1707)